MKQKSDKLVLEISDSTIRIKENNFVKKWFSRNYRTEKSVKEFEKVGYGKGKHSFSVKDFKKMVKENLTSNKKFVIKKVEKVFEPDIEEVEGVRTNSKIRRALKSKLVKKFDFEGDLQKDGRKIIFLSKEDSKKEEIMFDEESF